MKVLVCGGRNYSNKKDLFNFLDNFCLQEGLISKKDEYGNYLPEGITIISGKARGADQLAIDWAVVNWAPFEEYPADWDKYGKSAGYIRNKQMLVEGKPDIVIAFPGGEGTANMVKIARDAGVEVIQVE